MIKVNKLTKIYKVSETVKVLALKNATFNVKEGEFMAIMGPSGSGKSTLLRQLGLLDQPSKGAYYINDLNLCTIPDAHQSTFRLKHLGYVFQQFALLNELTAEENVLLPLYMQGMKKEDALKEAKRVLNIVGLSDKYKMLPPQLSQGQQQRVAIARAIIHKPKLLLADEPCANLDTENSKQILELFTKLNKELNQTILMVTHEPWHTDYVSRLMKLQDGKIVYDKKKKQKYKAKS